MGKKKATRKLSVKKQTMRKLDVLTSDQLQRAAGGTKVEDIQINADAFRFGTAQWTGNLGASWVGPRPPGSFGCTTV